MNFYTLNRLVLAMKLTAILIFSVIIQTSAAGYAQRLNISFKNAPMETIFNTISKQSGYDLIYNDFDLKGLKRISLNLKDIALEEGLKAILKDQELTYLIKEKTIIIKKKEKTMFDRMSDLFNRTDPVKGLVMTEDGRGLPGAVIQLKGKAVKVTSNEKGEFSIDAPEGSVLEVAFIGYKTEEIAVRKNITRLSITLVPEISKLDEVSVEGYRKGSQRLATSNISRITGDELMKQPVSNPLQALQGRIPGMVVNQTTGVPGARVNIQIRGRANFDNTLSSDQPLFVIDGVPMAANNDKVNATSGPFGAVTGEGLSAFAGLNSADIESIDVLKDADATAIYGSRGANGVILITTKKGKQGKMKMNATVTSGVSTVTTMAKMMNTQQYLEMRNEAFTNDKLTKTNTNAYDLLLWDQTRYTDFADLLVGNNANTTDAQFNFSGGSTQTQYRLGGGYHKEGTVWPGNKSADRFSANFNSRSISENGKFTMDFSGLYSLSKNDLVAGDLSSAILLPPNFKLYNEDGTLSWSEGGFSSANAKDNPLAALNQQYLSSMININANLNLSYKITPDLMIRSSFGYNTTQNDDRRITPISAQNPFKANLTGQSAFGNSLFKNWIAEPQLEYNKNISKGKLNALFGATYNKRTTSTLVTTGSNYTSDDLLGSLTGATVTGNNSFKEYNYQAFFGRLNYNWEDKYIVNFTGRRDGSSRFGPEYRFSNFGAAGAAWLFSNEEFLKDNKVLSYGKLRASYGVTGNDQIGDYSYLDTWTAGTAYADSTTLAPGKLYTPTLHWERNAKFELGVELGFLKDRILFTASAYQNISSDPLVSYPLPRTTGFSSIVNNLNGVKVQNKGLELTLNTKNLTGSDPGVFTWSTDFNITIPRNMLKAYPDLENSSYATKYTIGQSLNQAFSAQFLGVDPITGLYKVQDLNGDGVMGSPDFSGTFTTDPRYYGGLNNNFSYKRFNLSFFLQFTKQLGRSWKAGNLYNPPGMIFNVPTEALSRWQSEGQQTDVQRYSTSAGAITGLSGFYAYMFSGGIYTDASFLRMKNVYLSYDLPVKWLSLLHITSCKLYAQGQNLFVITGYKGGDPEVQNYTRMAPLRTIMGGLQLSL